MVTQLAKCPHQRKALQFIAAVILLCRRGSSADESNRPINSFIHSTEYRL